MSCEIISGRKADYYVNNPFACIIDIRDENEYNKSHIKNSVNIPYDIINAYLSHQYMGSKLWDNKGNERCSRIMSDKTKTYVIYCDRGAMSMIICNKMSQQGYVTKTVVGGFLKYNGKYIV